MFDVIQKLPDIGFLQTRWSLIYILTADLEDKLRVWSPEDNKDPRDLTTHGRLVEGWLLPQMGREKALMGLFMRLNTGQASKHQGNKVSGFKKPPGAFGSGGLVREPRLADLLS